MEIKRYCKERATRAKRFGKALAAVSLITVLMLSGCGTVEVENGGSRDGESMFVKVEQTDTWCVVYNKYTRVMYAVSEGPYNRGSFVLLVNDDGTPMLWED